MTLPRSLRIPVLLLALSLVLHALEWVAKAHGGGHKADGLILLGSALATVCTLVVLVRLQQAAPPLR